MPVGGLLCIVPLVEKGKRKGGLIEGLPAVCIYIYCLLLCIKYVM